MATTGRITQAVLEVLRQEGSPKAVITQAVVEVLRANTAEAPEPEPSAAPPVLLIIT